MDSQKHAQELIELSVQIDQLERDRRSKQEASIKSNDLVYLKGNLRRGEDK